MITDLLARHAEEHPDRTFVVTDGAEWSFGAVDAAARRFGAMLQARGVAPGDHVALIAGNSAGFLVAWFGINLAGAVAVTVNIQLVGDGLAYVVAQSEAKLIVADRAFLSGQGAVGQGAFHGIPLIELAADTDLMAGSDGAELRPVRLPPLAPATMMYTSGTTGLPKGVVNSHAAYEAAGAEIVAALGFSPQDRCMVVLPLFHANPQMYAVMSALQVGYALVLREKFSATSFFADARRFRATCFTYVGTILSILVARHDEDRDHALRFCTGGGAPEKVWREVEQRFGVKVRELYGMTEIGGFVSLNTEGATRIGSCGRLRPDMDVRIVDAEDEELPADAQGEIVVRPRKPGVILSGYWRQPDKMVEASRNLWFHTGDRGHIDADGYLHFHGRIKELIRRGGEMVSPVEVETVLRKMPGVADCAVVGIDDAVLGQEIKVLVVPDAAPLAPADVLAFLDGRVPSFMIPRYVEFAASVPKTETEKVQRHKIAYVDARVHDMASAERRIQPRHGGVVSGTAGEG
ncbi:class I adenylate-forming enzyme family protein [Phreatobacter cathodiphilus]|uniref:ATP-dependent acyl-CoA ligase n=1 Tax=Phreatobacter cathodiphilus TaxID=1868589 RepID=A0A2S0N8X4_9HYPH|nr:AMP-binding protein [Phreatobacter cathodiphilus]AVO44598.1 ATP-dependent acyl-CoA ligase [Phreatobacter cathodiphilus]